MPFPWNQSFNSFRILTFSNSFTINGSTVSFHSHEMTFLKVQCFWCVVPDSRARAFCSPLPFLKAGFRPPSFPPLVSPPSLGLGGLCLRMPPILASRPTGVAGALDRRITSVIWVLLQASSAVPGQPDLDLNTQDSHVGHFLKIRACKSRAQPEPSPSGYSKTRQPWQ